MHLAIIADDLTGACDTAVKMREQSFHAKVLFKAPERLPDADQSQVFAIYTDSRREQADEAEARVRRVTRCFREHGFCFYKKIDSMFRGNVAAEIDAMADELGVDFVIVAPAAPQNDRLVLHGKMMSSRKVIPADEINAILSANGREYVNIPIELVRKGKDALLEALNAIPVSKRSGAFIDAETVADLDTVAAACTGLERAFLPVGTSGLIASLSKSYWKLNRDDSVCSAPRIDAALEPVLLVIGSCHPLTRQQVQYFMKEAGVASVTLNVRECLGGHADEQVAQALMEGREFIRQGVQVLLLLLDSFWSEDVLSDTIVSVNHGDVSSPLLADCIARTAAGLVEQHRFSALVLSGGETAQRVLERLGTQNIDLICELLPGIALGRLEGAVADQLLVATKSGGFGETDVFIEILKGLGIASD